MRHFWPEFLKRQERGDTVVEVLIAVAVMSLILGGAFVTANRSLQGTRDAQERQNALKIAEGQVEQLKYLAGTTPDSLFGASVPASYCLNGTPNALSSSNAACTVNADGNPTTVEPAYHIAIVRATNDFTVDVNWTSIRGNDQDQVELKYRLYK